MAKETIEQVQLPPEYMLPHVQQALANVGGTWDSSGNHRGDGLIYQNQLPYVDQNGNPIPRLAEFNQDQMGAHDLAREGIGAYQPYLDTATESLGQGLDSFSPEAQQGFQDLNTQGTHYNIGQEYLNPYQQEVTDRTMSEIRRQQNMDMNAVGDAAANAGSFGGSRLGVLESETIRGHDANRANTLASLNASNFTQAQNIQEQHRQRQLQGANQGAQIAGMGADVGFQGAQIASGIGGLQQQYNTNDISTLGAVGDQQQKLQQIGMDVNYENYLQDKNRPFEMAAFYSDIMKGVPSGQQQTTMTNSKQSGLAQGLGTIGTLAAAGEQFGWWGNDAASS